MAGWSKVATVGDVPQVRPHIVEVDGTVLALYSVDGAILATGGLCPHEGECFESGYVEAGTVECSLHYAVFDITSGTMLTGPATAPLQTYPTRLEGEDIYVRV